MDEIKMAMQLGQAGLFLWLFLRVDARAQAQAVKHDLDIARLYNLRINDLKWLAKLPTDLDGDYRLGPDSTVKA